MTTIVVSIFFQNTNPIIRRRDPVLGQLGDSKPTLEIIPSVRLVLRINLKLNPFNFTPCSGWLVLYFHPKEEVLIEAKSPAVLAVPTRAVWNLENQAEGQGCRICVSTAARHFFFTRQY